MGMGRREFLVRASGHGALLGALGCVGEPDNRITIGAMPPGTSWYVFAATLAQLLQDAVPDGTSVEVIARGGAIGNPILVDRGDQTIALAQAVTAAWAYRGDPAAYEREHRHLRALAGGLNRVWMAALMTEDYIKRTGHETLGQALRSDEPIRIVMKPRGSIVPVVADMLLESLGTSREQIVERGGEIIQVTANQISAILRNGRADLYLESVIRGHPTVTEVATTTPVRFLDLPEDTIARLEGPGAERTPMPAWFRGQQGPLDSVDMGTVLIIHENAPEELAYLVARTVCERRDAMAQAHRAWEDFDPMQAASLAKTGVRLHPGAAAYYRERGWI